MSQSTVRFVLVFVAGTVGCVPPLALKADAQLSCRQNRDCPDDAACAVEHERCVAARGSCVVGGDVLADGTACDSAGVVDGVCVFGVCAESVCGDGVVAAGEACDEGDANSDATTDACRSDCTAPRCGDAVVDSFEACDTNVGIGGSCNTCAQLTCRTDTASCDFDDSNGCECAPAVIDLRPIGAPVIDGDHGVIVSRLSDDQLALEHIDLDTGAHAVVTTFAPPTTFSDIVVDDGVAFVVFDGSLMRVSESGLQVIRPPLDESDGILRVVPSAGRFVARTSKRVVSFDKDGGDQRVLASLHDTSCRIDDRVIPGFSLAATAAGTAVFLDEGHLQLVPVDGTEPARTHPASPPLTNSCSGSVATIGEDIIVWDFDGRVIADVLGGAGSSVVRVTPTSARVLVTFDDLRTQPGAELVVVGQHVVACATSIVASEHRLLIVEVDGGPARTLVNSDSCNFAIGASRVLYRSNTALQQLVLP